MNFIQIGKYKANFVDFVILSSRLEITTNKKLNWIILSWKVSSIDLILLKLDNLNKKNVSSLQLVSDQMKTMKHIPQYIEVVHY